MTKICGAIDIFECMHCASYSKNYGCWVKKHYEEQQDIIKEIKKTYKNYEYDRDRNTRVQFTAKRLQG